MGGRAGTYLSLPTLTTKADYDSKRRKRLAERRSDPLFHEYLRSTTRRMSTGDSLTDIREYIGLSDSKNDLLWDDLMYTIGETMMNPMNLVLEWSVRQQTRYKMAIDLYNRNKEANDRDGMAKAILTLSKIDENALELHKALGLIKPIHFEDGSEGISDDDVNDAERRLNSIVEERIKSKLFAGREAQQPESVLLLDELESGQSSDQLEPAPLAKNPAV